MRDMHNEIMNLQCDVSDLPVGYGHTAYKLGHRDARHAAAELASAEIESNRAAIDELIGVINSAMRHGGLVNFATARAAIAKHQTTTEKEQ